MNNIQRCRFITFKTIELVYNGKISSIKVFKNKKSCFFRKTFVSNPEAVFLHLLLPVVLMDDYHVEVNFVDGKTESIKVSISSLFTEEFDKKYYCDEDLGAIYLPEKTIFRVWSPISTKIILNVYFSGTPKIIDSVKGNDDKLYQLTMKKNKKGLFSVVLNQDCQGLYYTYTVYNSFYPKGKEIVDPYAKSAGINGLRGMVVDFSKTNPAGWNIVSYLSVKKTNMVVYETHIADVTSSLTWHGKEENRKKFLGLIEEGTRFGKNNQIKTGFDHIVDLGVNAVQLLPIFDQDNDEVHQSFNWGYNPLNYNVLEGSYSSDPYDGYSRIREFKMLVKKFYEKGITIIMDVVYNHLSRAIGSNFDVLMPGYYFRLDRFGNLSNGSGCGNETASERWMFRKFMIDSTSFWIKEYKLGGFRFDLMGLHDLETMNLLVSSLKKINPNAVVYGEPWSGGESSLSPSLSAAQGNTYLYRGYGQFNNQMRDAMIKGGMCSIFDKGWITNTERVDENDARIILDGIKGITTYATDDCEKTVNFASCHDNYTLFDRITAAGIKDEKTIAEMAMLSNMIVLSSQGTSFILAGEEMLRSKAGDGNSYSSSYQVNEIDYSLLIKNYKIYQNIKKMVNLKTSLNSLGLNHNEIAYSELFIVSINSDNTMIKEIIKDTKEYVIYHTNGCFSDTEIDISGYQIYLDTVDRDKEEKFILHPLETLVLYK